MLMIRHQLLSLAIDRIPAINPSDSAHLKKKKNGKKNAVILLIILKRGRLLGTAGHGASGSF